MVSPFQHIIMYQNYITKRNFDHEPVIFFYQVKHFRKKLKYKDYTDKQTDLFIDRQIERERHNQFGWKNV